MFKQYHTPNTELLLERETVTYSEGGKKYRMTVTPRHTTRGEAAAGTALGAGLGAGGGAAIGSTVTAKRRKGKFGVSDKPLKPGRLGRFSRLDKLRAAALKTAGRRGAVIGGGIGAAALGSAVLGRHLYGWKSGKKLGQRVKTTRIK
jgi:hypothetical protein